jgi:hypothetical protein
MFNGSLFAERLRDLRVLRPHLFGDSAKVLCSPAKRPRLDFIRNDASDVLRLRSVRLVSPSFVATSSRLSSSRTSQPPEVFIPNDVNMKSITDALKKSATKYGKSSQRASAPKLQPGCDILRRLEVLRELFRVEPSGPSRAQLASRIFRATRTIARARDTLEAEWRIANSKHR